ncbi:ABC transporter permease subunit [Plantibacter sp. RU18]|uniref:ABC transporter permease subunit n=1 Tax=Plantibacter sp. RU18 TaxID=3158143 RepID=UPI003D36B68A
MTVTVPDAATTGIAVESHTAFAISVATVGVFAGQLAVVVLGVLMITGEYSTGMIRSSLAAVPDRLSMLAGKALVLFACSFVIGAVCAGGAWAIATPGLLRKGYSVSLFDPTALSVVGAMGLYLGLVSVFALGLGTMLRSSAGGIAAGLGTIFLLPIALSTIFSLTQITWFNDAMPYLLSVAGQRLVNSDTTQFAAWQNILIVAAWAAVAVIGGAAVLKRRDA